MGLPSGVFAMYSIAGQHKTIVLGSELAGLGRRTLFHALDLVGLRVRNLNGELLGASSQWLY